MTTVPDHVTFRPGDLTPMLSRGGRAMGSTAKRDLARYYLVIGDLFQEWQRQWDPPPRVWEVIVTYVATRDWLVPPEREELISDFGRFITSPMGTVHDRVTRMAAAAALTSATWPQFVAIIHQAEASQAERTAGATSAT